VRYTRVPLLFILRLYLLINFKGCKRLKAKLLLN
jgi:hypothetical protein